MGNNFLITALLCVTHLVVSSASPSYSETNQWGNIAKPLMMPDTDYENAMHYNWPWKEEADAKSLMMPDTDYENVMRYDWPWKEEAAAKPFMMPNTDYENTMHYNWQEEAEILQVTGALTVSKMSQILNTGAQIGFSVMTTYLIWQHPNGELLTFNSGYTGPRANRIHVHAEVAFINYLRSNRIQLNRVRRFWLSNSPCSRCATALINFFGRAAQGIVISVANVYKGGTAINLQQTNRRGLEALRRRGFRLQKWDWRPFRDFLNRIRFTGNVIQIVSDYISRNAPYNNPVYRQRDGKTTMCLDEVQRRCYGQCRFGDSNLYPQCP